MKDVIVTYGEDNTVGKEMLRRYRQGVMGCQCCRDTVPVHESGECERCRKDPTARSWPR